MRMRLAAIASCCLALALAAGAQGHDDARPDVEIAVQQVAVQQAMGQIVRELSAACPLADPADQATFEACRRALFTGSLLRQSVDTILVWGRPHARPGESLKDTTLTEFAPEVWTGLYAPLFMFDGTWRLDYQQGERLYRARLGVLFRNALDPGQYPYPFWHDARKWNDYQAANT